MAAKKTKKVKHHKMPDTLVVFRGEWDNLVVLEAKHLDGEAHNGQIVAEYEFKNFARVNKDIYLEPIAID